MKSKFKYYIVLLLGIIGFWSVASGQNLLYNYDFEENDGSLDGWIIASGTELRETGGDHYAYLSGENGVLMQEVESIEVGKAYRCSIYFNYLFVKQTTGYGYALEYATELFIPEFTKGATNLRDFCNNNGGEWINLPDSYTGNDIVESFTVRVPSGAGSIYIAIGTKGALAKYEIDSVELVELETTPVSFLVQDRETGQGIPGAGIYADGSNLAFVTDNEGRDTIGLIPGDHDIEVIADWYAVYSTTITVGEQPQQVEILMDSVVKVKDVETRISKYGDNATPYPIYGHFWNDGLNFANEVIDTLTATLDYMVGGRGISTAKSVNDKLHASDHRFQIIKYQGGWSVSRNVGEQQKMILPYYRCGVLGISIGESDTILQVNTTPDGKGLGLVASEEGNFITWLRIGDELMKIVSVSSPTNYPITVEVERGLDNSELSAHASGTAVTAPLYSNPPAPGGDNSDLEYFRTVYEMRQPELEDNIVLFALDSHIDGIWIDILVGWLSTSNMVGGNYTLWNHEKNSVLSWTDIIKRTKDAIKEIFIGAYSRLGYFPVIYGNNVLYDQSFNSGSRGYMMMENETHEHVIDGFCHENSWGHMSDNPDNIDNDGEPVVTGDKFVTIGDRGHFLEWYIGNTWIDRSKAIALLAQLGLPNQPMTINAGFKNRWFAEDLTNEVRYDFNKYSYASYLMAVEVDKDSLISCRMGISPMVKEGSQVSIHFEPFFYFDIGIPEETHPCNEFERYRVGNANLYARKFSNGYVLVNPFKHGMSTPLAISEITQDSMAYVDLESGQDSIRITQVQLGSREALFLLKAGFAPDTATGDTTSIHVPSVGTPFRIYPVPAYEYIYLDHEIQHTSDQIYYEIFDLAGCTVKSGIEFNGRRTKVNISGLPAGVYFIKLQGFPIIRKFVKLKP